MRSVMAKYHKGQRVSFSYYGVKTTGTVTRDQRTDIVFVRKDDTHRVIWMHELSLTLIGASDE